MNNNILNLLLLSTASLSSLNRTSNKKTAHMQRNSELADSQDDDMQTNTSQGTMNQGTMMPNNTSDSNATNTISQFPSMSDMEPTGTTTTTSTPLAMPPVFNEQVDALLPNNLMPRFVLPPLPYAYDALEPYIDAETMRIHHDRHHQTYINNLNSAISRYPEIYAYTLGQILTFADQLPSDIQSAVINNGGGHYNHSFFWNLLSPEGGGTPTGTIGEAIDRQFGSFSNFRRAFSAAALSVFGSGYAWLVLTPNGRLEIITTNNQDTPLPLNLIPLLTIDVWEHAYYLKHQNEREGYVNNFFNVINWPYVNSIYEAAQTK